MSPYHESATPEDVTKSAVGRTIFDYVPMHPSLSNPKKAHRYTVSIWKQSSPELQISPESWTEIANVERAKYQSQPAHKRLVEQDGELAMKYRERSIPFPSQKFAVDHGLTLAGFGFFNSSFTLQSPDLFTKLSTLFINGRDARECLWTCQSKSSSKGR